MDYRTFKLKKKSGGYRTISAPDKALKAYQQRKLKRLEKAYKKALEATPQIANVPHGFITGRNVVTAAQQHIGFKATIMMDLSEFFDTVHINMVPEQFRDKWLFNKQEVCGQGFVTSPMLANIAFFKTLMGINKMLQKQPIRYAFTMYADDIQISLDTENIDRCNEIISKVTTEVEIAGFRINSKKTRIKYQKYGWRRILGVNVGETEVRATRKTMQKLRAAKHQMNHSSAGGLTNWSKCNLPKRQ